MKRIKLTKGKFALVDDKDFEWITQWNWYATKRRGDTYYAVRGQWNPEIQKEEMVFMHRLILGTPEGKFTDHVNGDGLDNRKANLRVCTRSQNAANCMNQTLHKPKTSRYRGVRKLKRSRMPWKAAIRYMGKEINLGYFEKEEDAARAYDKKRVEIHGEFAMTNFPIEP